MSISSRFTQARIKYTILSKFKENEISMKNYELADSSTVTASTLIQDSKPSRF